MLKIGFSPCPNDTFIFDAMLHGRIDTEGLEFEAVMEDVETLNRMAASSELPITKLSYHAFAHLTGTYVLLDAGSALGNNCGPLLIARAPMDTATVEQAHIVIPGKMTTANFLLSIAYPEAHNKTAVVFSEIEDAVLDGRANAGVIIHENRFTYAQRGLVCIKDLGMYWEQSTGLPIPLGGIVVRRDVPRDTQLKINRVLRRSVEYAFAHPQDVMPFVRAHAQEMDDAVMQSHIDLYVSQYTVDLGEVGRQAIRRMFEIGAEKGILASNQVDLFL